MCTVSLQAGDEVGESVAQLPGVYTEEQRGIFRHESGGVYLFWWQDARGELQAQSWRAGWSFADAPGAPRGQWHAWAASEDSTFPPASGWQAPAESGWLGPEAPVPLAISRGVAEDAGLWEHLWTAVEGAMGDCHQVLTHPDTVRFLRSAAEVAEVVCASSWRSLSSLAIRVCSTDDVPALPAPPRRPESQEGFGASPTAWAAWPAVPATTDSWEYREAQARLSSHVVQEEMPSVAVMTLAAAVAAATEEEADDALSCISEVASEELAQETTSTTAVELEDDDREIAALGWLSVSALAGKSSESAALVEAARTSEIRSSGAASGGIE